MRDAGCGCSGLKSLRVTKYCDLQHLGLCGGDGVPCTGQADLGQDGTCLGRDGSCETRPFCLSLEETFFFLFLQPVACHLPCDMQCFIFSWAGQAPMSLFL